MTVRSTWAQVLAWRMRRQYLDPVSDASVSGVVSRLCGVQAQVASSAELAALVRSRTARRGDVGRALGDGRLIRTWAMRGTLHLLAAEDAGAYLSLMASGRSWERPSWQRYFGVTPAQIESLRDAVRTALEGRVLTREELVDAVRREPGLTHLADALRSGWSTLLKPLAWQGDLCSGPSRSSRVTFMRPEDASARWVGLPDPDEAAPLVIAAWLGAHGPATGDAFGHWLAGGWFGKRRLRAWFDALGDRLAEVDVEGERTFLLAEHVGALVSTQPTDSVRLLPGFDQYVLGPGTADGRVIPAERRRDVSRASGWIAPMIVSGGSVAGTWVMDATVVRVSWFEESGPLPRREITAEVARLGEVLGRALAASFERT